MRDELVRAIRGMVGTRFRHQAREPGVGLDCVGVGVCAARSLGWELDDFTAYRRDPNPEQLMEYLDRAAIEIQFVAAEPGDILLIAIDEVPKHVGFLTDAKTGMMVHAYAGARQVVEMRLDRFVEGELHSVWRFKELWRDPCRAILTESTEIA